MRVLYQREDHLAFIPADANANLHHKDYIDAVEVLLREYYIKYGKPLTGVDVVGQRGPFYVWNPNRDSPKKIHHSLEDARSEAVRLAKGQPNETFIVLAEVGRCRGRSYYPCNPQTEVRWEN